MIEPIVVVALAWLILPVEGPIVRGLEAIGRVINRFSTRRRRPARKSTGGKRSKRRRARVVIETAARAEVLSPDADVPSNLRAIN